MAQELFRPVVDEDSAPFWEGARRAELRMQKCRETGRLIFPPRHRSPWALDSELLWVPVSGYGTIWSFVVPHPPLMGEFADLAPYPVILVALDEDETIRLVGNLVARPGGRIDEVRPESIEIGARVRVHFEPRDNEISMPRWTLVDEAQKD